jgi:cbb3-type cytochrome c oxidase subunit III
MNPFKRTAAQQRENADPDEQVKPVPFVLLILIAGLFTWGVVYLATSQMSTKQDWGDQRTLADVAAPPKPAKADGAALFSANCVACHQAAGTGVPGVFPPLAGSEWVNGKPDAVIQILLHGIDGDITVKGGNYHGQMPNFGGKFSDEEIAAVLSYVRSQWGNQSPAIDGAAVKQGREATKAHDKSWSGGKELAQFQ